jgi:hypothetical protein
MRLKMKNVVTIGIGSALKRYTMLPDIIRAVVCACTKVHVLASKQLLEQHDDE